MKISLLLPPLAVLFASPHPVPESAAFDVYRGVVRQSVTRFEAQRDDNPQPETDIPAGPPSLEIPPPLRFRGENVALVLFVHDVRPFCPQPSPGRTVIACQIDSPQLHLPLMVMPHPCAAMGLDAYAYIACHELAHVNGWSGQHED